MQNSYNATRVKIWNLFLLSKNFIAKKFEVKKFALMRPGPYLPVRNQELICWLLFGGGMKFVCNVNMYSYISYFASLFIFIESPAVPLYPPIRSRYLSSSSATLNVVYSAYVGRSNGEDCRFQARTHHSDCQTQFCRLFIRDRSRQTHPSFEARSSLHPPSSYDTKLLSVCCPLE